MTSDDNKTATSKPRRWKRYLFAGLGLIFLLLLGSALLPWVAPSLIPGLVLNLAPNLPPSKEAVAGKSAAMQTLENRLTAIERRLETVADDVAANVAKRPKVVPVASNKLWWIAETERYLMEAGERLENGAKVTAALPALKSAKQTLANVDIAAADAVKQALDGEIRLLSEYRNKNAAQALTAIDALLKRLTNNMAAAQDKETSDGAAEAASDAPASDPDLWNRLMVTAGDRLKHLVVTQKKSDTEAARITRGLVTRSLLLARTAVLSGDDVSYHYALVNAMQALEQNHESDGAIHNELQTLHALDIADTPPRIGEALSKILALADEMTRKEANRETGP